MNTVKDILREDANEFGCAILRFYLAAYMTYERGSRGTCPALCGFAQLSRYSPSDKDWTDISSQTRAHW
jgi:hypothetical protein